MPNLSLLLLSAIQRLWVAPEAHFSELRDRSERWLSLLRLAILCALLVLTVFNLIRDPLDQNLVSVGFALVAITAAALLHLAVLARWAPEHLGFVAIAFELGLLGLLIAAHMAVSSPLAGTNDLFHYPLLLAMVAGTALRFDPRASLFAGVLATLLYGGVLVWVAVAIDAAAMSTPDPLFGRFSWPIQIARMLLIVAVACAATTANCWVQQIVSASSRDELTGLLNRRVMNESLHRLVEAGRPFAVVIVDVDFFKRLNDAHGHAVGDAALRHLASLLQRSFRTVDIVARFGGEEFAVLMVDAAPDGSARRLDQVRETIASTPIRTGGPGMPTRTLPALTVSMGAAVWPEDGVTVRQLLEVADRRLYEAKRGGRNRLVGPNLGIPREFEESEAVSVS